MKDMICAGAGAIGGIIAAALGGWDTALITLITLMTVDYLSGVVCAGVFHKSTKSNHGSLQSDIGYKGLFKKCMILCFVLVGQQVKNLTGTEYIRDVVIIGFAVNELISIVENAGLMGLPIPNAVKKMIDVLHEKEEM